MMKEGPYLFVFHWCLPKRSVSRQFIFKNSSSFINSELHLTLCGDGVYICKSCHSKIEKSKVPCHEFFVVWLTEERCLALFPGRTMVPDRYSPLWISNAPQAGFQPTQNLRWGFADWSCAVLTSTTPQWFLKWNCFS